MKRILAILFIMLFASGCTPQERIISPEERAVQAVNEYNDNAYEWETDTRYKSRFDSSFKIEYINTFEDEETSYHEVSQYQFVVDEYGMRKATSNWYYVDAETLQVIPEYFEGYEPNPEWEGIFLGK